MAMGDVIKYMCIMTILDYNWSTIRGNRCLLVCHFYSSPLHVKIESRYSRLSFAVLTTEFHRDTGSISGGAKGKSRAEETGIFVGKIFRPMGEARSPVVREAVESGGGRVVSEDSDEIVDAARIVES